MEALMMARKKATTGKPTEGKASTIAVTLRGSKEWKAWLESLAKHTRLDVAKVIDRAVIDFAKKEGFEPEAPER